MPFKLPELPFAHNALEPYIDKLTMEIHHGKHHAAYTNNLNTAISGTPLENKSIEEILKEISKHTPVIRNNGGGYYNHNFFWESLTPNSEKKPKGKLAEAINNTFGTFEKFQEEFEKAGVSRFGSGWAWLCVRNNALKICSTPNQDNPLMDVGDCQGKPLLGLDVWEHAYYLKYQNKRPDYIKAFWNVVNWEKVNERFEK